MNPLPLLIHDAQIPKLVDILSYSIGLLCVYDSLPFASRATVVMIPQTIPELSATHFFGTGLLSRLLADPVCLLQDALRLL